MAESLMAPPPEVDPTVVDAGYGDDFEGFANTTSEVETQVPTPQEQPKQPVEESPLAQAQRVAEGSGMLRQTAHQPGPVMPEQTPAPASPPISSEPPSSAMPTDSPFQVSTHQDLTDDAPMAQQVSPPNPPEPAVEPVQVPVHQAPVETPPPAAAPSFGRGVFSDAGSGGSRGPFLDRLSRFSAAVRQHFGARAMFLIDNDGQVILDEVENPKLIQVARTLANASYTAHRQSAGSAAVGNLHVKIGANSTLEVVPIQSRYGLLVLGVIFAAPIGAERVIELTGWLENAVDPESA